jgi:hypothetical protein
MTDRSRRPFPRFSYSFTPSGVPLQYEEGSFPPWGYDAQAPFSLAEPGNPGPQRELADALGKFLRAPDWLASLRVLLSHPVLLTERVSNLLREGAEFSQRRGDIADEISMLTHLAFLEYVSQRGFFTVLNELQEKNVKH